MSAVNQALCAARTMWRALMAVALMVAPTADAAARAPFARGGNSGGGGETPLSDLITTTADATAFQASCAGAGPNYPAQWDWDPAAFLGPQPQSATEAMGLTPKIEQYRNGA